MFFEREVMVKQEQLNDMRRQREAERLLRAGAQPHHQGPAPALNSAQNPARRLLAGVGRILLSGAGSA